MKTNFFTELSKIGLSKVAIEVITASDGSITVLVMPKTNVKDDLVKALVPFQLSGSAEEMDEDFFAMVSEPLQQRQRLLTNLDAFEASTKDVDKKVKEKSESKEEAKVSEKPTVSKEQQAKLDKIAKAEANLTDVIVLITNAETFLVNKGKLKRFIDALDGVVKTTKIDSILLAQATIFFTINNDDAFQFTAFDGSLPNKTEEVLVKQIIPVPLAIDLPAVEEIEDEQPGNSIADMQAERTEQRIHQLASLGLTDSESGFVGYGFTVISRMIQDQTNEYWDELIAGIQKVVNSVDLPQEAVSVLKAKFDADKNALNTEVKTTNRTSIC